MRSSLSKEEILKCGSGELYGMENGKLPLPPMLMFDRITDINDEDGKAGLGTVTAEFDINPDLWFFKLHFVGDPVMPGCLGLDALWQLIGFHLIWNGHQGLGRALGCGEVKFTGQVLPTAKLVRYQVELERVINRKLMMIIGRGEVHCDNELIYTAEKIKVGLFQKDQM